ncbi:hypothetical protein ABZ330_07170 [Streptomyces sp. NPDC006172]|uniref:hypothetical protein n=1 Tax=Streptomyces sp. NPDC006172 TaxID=3154470 RepID=UPI0033C4A7BD
MAEHDSDRGEQDVPFDEEAAWAAIVAGYGEEPADPPGAKPFKPIEDLALPDTEPNDDGAAAGSGAGPWAGSKAGPVSVADPGAPVTDPGAPVTDPGADADAVPEKGTDPGPAAGSGSGSGDDSGDGPAKPLGSSISFAPGVGPRDYSLSEPSDDDFDEDDEGHFVPPEPPPLPTADTTARFAWLGVLGGPVLLLLAVLLGWEMTWWLTTVGIGGFLGGFATLVMRMNPGDDEDDGDPGRGAVV